jgi:hypothetical protein
LQRLYPPMDSMYWALIEIVMGTHWPGKCGSGAAIEVAEQYVRTALSGYDASHDWYHIERVVNLTQRLLEKYAHTDKHQVSKWLSLQSYPQERSARVLYVLEHIGFTSEMKEGNIVEIPVELSIVQDAERLP